MASMELPGITTEEALAAAVSVLPPLREQIEDGEPVEALSNAFLEGARFAAAEIVAQLIEAGVDARIALDLTPAP
jgi:hypothetical protein